MNTKVTDPRKILLNLRKKYCVDNFKKYNKSESSSSDEFSSEEVIEVKPSSLSSRTSRTEKDTVLSPKISIKPPCQKHIPGNSENSVIEIPSKITQNSINYAKSLSEDNKRSESVLSSVKSDVDVNTYLDIEEDFSDASRSSSVDNILANVHLISDDVLEDIETNFGSDQSNYNDEERSTRISVVHSIKSIQLGSPLEPPHVELYDYDSDFEDSCIESVRSDVTPETVASVNSLTSSHDRLNVQPSSEVDDGILEITREEITFNKIDSKSFVETDSISDVLKYSDEADNLNVLERRSKTDKESTDDEITNDKSVQELDILKRLSIIEDKVVDNVHSSLLKDSFSDKDFRKVVDLDAIPDSKSLIHKTNAVKKQLADKNIKSPWNNCLHANETYTNTDIGVNVNLLKVDVGINVKFSDSSSNDGNVVQNSICSKNNSSEAAHDKGTNVRLITSTCNNIGIQTKAPTYNSIGIQTKAIESQEKPIKSVCSHKIRQQKYYVSTSVKSTKSRPFINASKLSCNLTTKGSDYNPYAFSERVAEGLSIEELINEMIRNQIAMTRHFMDSHHRLYMQCCQTVQFMNEKYKKKKFCFFKP